MLNIAICEDNEAYRDTIRCSIEDILAREAIPGRIALITGDPFEVEKKIKTGGINVFFIDIDLNAEINGYDLARTIRETVVSPYLVFITEHLEYVLQAFKVRPFDFLPKPATGDTIKRCLVDIYRDYLNVQGSREKEKDSSRIVVKSGASVFYIKVGSIVFIEKLNNKAIIHTVDKDITCYETLKTLSRMLGNHKDFIRCHKSFIVNKNYFSKVSLDKMEIVFETGHRCDIGRTYRNRIRDI